MRLTLVLVLLGCAAAQTPNPTNPTNSKRLGVAGNSLWRQNLLGAIGQPPGNATMRDIRQIEQYMLSAAPYCTSLTPGDYEANRELARQMTAYLMTVNTMATDPQTRSAALRASRAVAVFPCAFPQAQPNPGRGAASAAETSRRAPVFPESAGIGKRRRSRQRNRRRLAPALRNGRGQSCSGVAQRRNHAPEPGRPRHVAQRGYCRCSRAPSALLRRGRHRSARSQMG